MAGYDFVFFSSDGHRPIVKNWLSKYRTFAKEYNLQISYRIRKIDEKRIETYVTVDGKLGAMQHLHRILPEKIANYLHLVDTKARNVLFAFLKADKKGVEGITELIYGVTKQIQPVDLTARPSGQVLPSSLFEKICFGNSRKIDIKAIQSVITSLDNWILRRISNEQAMILSDQGVENWLKVMLKFAKNNRDRYPKIINYALSKGIITKMDAYRLKRFHKTRNGAQHRGKKVSMKTLSSAFCYYTNLFSKFY